MEDRAAAIHLGNAAEQVWLLEHGIWVRRTDRNQPGREDKIAAVGVRIKRWVTLHGVALNVGPNL